jgi:NAD(P)-dependent dehydrogenase (short-subunit alcohol dehydrogenase family)
MDLAGKTILVTGAARRVGRAIAEELGRAGARVAIHHAHSDADAASLANAMRDAFVIRADLRDPAAPARVIDEVIARGGAIHGLVNCAGDYERTPLAELTDEKWASMLELNLTAPMRLVRAAAPRGVRAIVNIVDVAAWQPWPRWLAYSTSKAALLHLTRCLALELAPSVRVNAIAPGTVIYPDDWTEEQRAHMNKKIPLGHAGNPADVARACRFLLSEEFLTGVCLPVDGGAGLR